MFQLRQNTALFATTFALAASLAQAAAISSSSSSYWTSMAIPTATTIVPSSDTPVATNGAVMLEIPDWSSVQSDGKPADDGWGGIGADSWKFPFNGKDYIKEDFTLTLYKKEKDTDTWESQRTVKKDGKDIVEWIPVADIKASVYKKLKCSINTQTGQLPLGRVTATNAAPWLTFDPAFSQYITDATCTETT